MVNKEAMNLALEALAVKFSEGWHEGIKIDASDIMLLNDAAQALAEQPAQRPIKTFHDGKAWPVQEQAQQEPFGFAVMENPIAPPVQRTWVGLTDEEIDYLCELAYEGDEELILTVQAKLKEKNT